MASEEQDKKTERVLSLYTRLLQGEEINKAIEAEHYGVLLKKFWHYVKFF